MSINSYLLPIENLETFHFAIVYEKTNREKYFYLFVGDGEYPSFSSSDSSRKNIFIYFPPLKERNLVNKNSKGYMLVEVLAVDSIVPVIKALNRKYPNASLTFVFQSKSERPLIEHNLKIFRKLKLVDWTN